MIYLMFLLGSVGRAYVGTGRGPDWLGRWSVYPLIALLSAYVGLAPIQLDLSLLVYLWAALIASLNLALGYTQWESWKWMVARFGLPSLVLVLPMIYLHTSPSLLLYPLLSVLAGLFYPHRQKVFDLEVPYWWHWSVDPLDPKRAVRVFDYFQPLHFPFNWWDSARLAEVAAGAAILGGLSVL
jgi:hypothetical protein